MEVMKMRKLLKKVSKKVGAIKMRACLAMVDNRGESSVSTAVSILTAVVLGALVLAGLYALLKDTVLPSLAQKIQDMFNYAG
ncbi:MAG: DUF6133 family protein [Proteiniphilum sp.]|jgi:hypothetical protein|nr:DUF6133 family protein [Proteiniphilum sp.]